MATLSDATAATLALEFVVFGVEPSHADLAFEAPVPAEQPCVTVRDAQTAEPSLIAVVLEFAEVGAEEFEIHVEVADVVLSRQRVHAEEVASESLAEPVTRLGLYEPVLALAASRQIPDIDIAADVDRPTGSQPHLDPEVDVHEGVRKQIRLYRHVLRLHLRTERAADDYHQKKNRSFHHSFMF